MASQSDPRRHASRNGSYISPCLAEHQKQSQTRHTFDEQPQILTDFDDEFAEPLQQRPDPGYSPG